MSRSGWISPPLESRAKSKGAFCGTADRLRVTAAPTSVTLAPQCQSHTAAGCVDGGETRNFAPINNLGNDFAIAQGKFTIMSKFGDHLRLNTFLFLDDSHVAA